MKRVLDKTDEKILEELTRNARLAHNDIAMKVNLPRNAVRLIHQRGFSRGRNLRRRLADVLRDRGG